MSHLSLPSATYFLEKNSIEAFEHMADRLPNICRQFIMAVPTTHCFLYTIYLLSLKKKQCGN